MLTLSKRSHSYIIESDIDVVTNITLVITSSIPVGEVWKPPDVTQTHGVAKTRQDEVEFVAPVSSFFILITLERPLLFVGREQDNEIMKQKIKFMRFH